MKTRIASCTLNKEKEYISLFNLWCCETDKRNTELLLFHWVQIPGSSDNDALAVVVS